MFQLSNVTGEGLDYVCLSLTFVWLRAQFAFSQLRTFLNLLPASESDNEKFLTDQPLEVCSSPWALLRARH